MPVDMIKGVLEEELEHSRSVEKEYLAMLSELPRGAITKKRIYGGEYYYRMYRDQGKVRTDYLGKLSEADVAEHGKRAEKRKYYEKMLREVRRKIRYLNKVLNVKAV